MERKAGLGRNVDIQSGLNTDITDQVFVLRQVPQLDFTAISSPPSVEPSPTIHPDNLPAIPHKHFLFPITGQIKDTIRNVGDFVKRFHELRILNENQILSTLIKDIQDGKDKLSEQSNLRKQIEKNKKLSNKDIAIYLHDRKTQKIISSLATKTGGVVTSLAQLFNLNIASINQFTQLDIDIPEQSGRDVVQDTLVNGVSLQIAKTRNYAKMIGFFAQDQVRIKTNETMIGNQLQQREEQIYKEYYHKALAVNSIVTKPPFDKVFAEIMAVIQSQPPADKNENSPPETSQTIQPLIPEKILAFHKFEIEKPTEYPDYQIACYYLTQINDCISRCVSVQNEDYLSSLINDPHKFEESYNLIKKLLDNINPKLQSDWLVILSRFANIDDLIIEREASRSILGVDIGIPSLPDFITSEVREELINYKFGLFYPKASFGTLDELHQKDVNSFLDNFQKQYPNWRSLNYSFWDFVKNRQMEFPKLSGAWMAVETIPTPSFGEAYEETPINKILGIKKRNLSWNQINQTIKDHKQELLTNLGLPTSLEIRLLTAIEWNLLANREGWGEYDNTEWTNTKCSIPYGICGVVMSHDCSNALCGVRLDGSGGWLDSNIGFRLAIVLS